MAFVTPIPDEQQNQFSGQGQTTPNPLAFLPPQGGGSAGQGGGAGPAAPSQGTSTQFGSTASRLSDYLGANKDQTQDMANKISGQMGDKFSSINQSIGNLSQQFGQQVSNSYTPVDPTVINEFKSNPSSVANDPTKAASFKGQLNSNYTGPNSFQEFQPYQGVQKDVQDAVQQSGLLNSYSGLSQYLRNNVEKNPTPGQNTLDSVLLQSSMPAFNTIKDSAAPFAGLTNYLDTTATTANQQAQEAKAQAPLARQGAQQALQDVSNPLVQSLNTGYQTAFDKSLQYNTGLNSIAEKIANGNFGALTAEEQKQIGYNPQLTELMNKYGGIFPTQAADKPINWSQFFTQGPQATTPTPSNTVTPDQLAQYQAISSLSGSAPQGVNFNMPTQLENKYLIPNETPSYDNAQAGNAIQNSYGPMYQALLDAGWGGVGGADKDKIQGYMTQLYSFLNQPQPSPVVTNPPPTPPPDPLHPIWDPGPGPGEGGWHGFV